MGIFSRKNILLIGALVVFTVGAFTLVKLYELGYRFTFSHGVTRPSFIAISPFTQGTTFFLDGEPVTDANAVHAVIDGDIITITVPAGLHDVVFARNKYSPWEKTLDIESGEHITVGPFNIPATTNGVLLKPTDAEYRNAVQLLAAGAKTPSEQSPVSSRDNTIEAFVRGQSLIAHVKSGTPPQSFCDTSCESEKEVVALQAEVRGLAFLPGRNDVLLMAVQDGIFAIELDTRGIQNFQVLYRGIRPTFAVSPEGLIYIKEGDSIFKIFLFPDESQS